MNQESFTQDVRIDVVNEHLTIKQYTKGLTFGTDALLLAGYIIKKPFKKALELGCGTGIISLLVSTRKKALHIDALEVQPIYASLATDNVKLNHLDSEISIIESDVRNYGFHITPSYDLVFANPPYMKNNLPECEYTSKQIARHEVMGTIEDFVSCASRCLKSDGSFYVVYPPDRLLDLLHALEKYHLEPKRMTFVYATTDHAPSLVLIEARKDGKRGLKTTKPLFIGATLEERKDSQDMQIILNEGSFPKDYE